MDEKKLLELKKKIDEAKTKLAELEGSRKHLMNELKTDWECSTLEQAQTKLAELEKESLKLSQNIQKGMEEITSKYDI